MEGFRWAYDLNGSKVPIIKPLVIPEATEINTGQIVDFTPGTGVTALGAAGVAFTGPAVGVAVHQHKANSGTTIKVSASPTAVYANRSTVEIVATDGSKTTFVCSGLRPKVDNIFKGGYIEVVECAANEEIKGKRIPIIASTGSTGTLTIPEQEEVFASGDKVRICPGPLAIGTTVWNLDSTGRSIDYAEGTVEGRSLVLVDVDPQTMTAYFKLRLHRLGNGEVIAIEEQEGDE